jgi:hypothetical protein
MAGWMGIEVAAWTASW